MHCWKCGEQIEIASGQKIGSRDECIRCGADLHSCRNCQFYDPSKNQQCSEPQAEWVRDKEAANYCDYFRPSPESLFSARQPSPSSNAVRKKFDSLFRL